ncbi:hypothetical protein [Clostridium disporicum]|uniref:hypothetical protein n=1 Tax=Clostridium disporicum TaxID=84024 RepID=UPI0034A378EC
MKTKDEFFAFWNKYFNFFDKHNDKIALSYILLSFVLIPLLDGYGIDIENPIIVGFVATVNLIVLVHYLSMITYLLISYIRS